MPRNVFSSFLMCCLAFVSALMICGCQSGGRSHLAQTRPARLWDAAKTSPPVSFARQQGKEMSVQFASIREPRSESGALSDLLTGTDIRIPLPESHSGGLRQIDPPRQAGANTIGAF